MKNIKETIQKSNGTYPEKILQFGEGNFLRAFADWMVDEANDSGAYQGSIVLCQPIKGGEVLKDIINNQDGAYTLVMRGIEEGEAVEKVKQITSVSRCINAYDDYEELMKLARSGELEVVISNTTEAGIAYKEGDRLEDAPPASFPAKVCVFLHERYQAFQGDMEKGLLFLPVELIDNNGAKLKEIVLRYAEEWGMDADFIKWVKTANKFSSTLVDRIVTGYPKDQLDYFRDKLGYEDNALVTSEVFNLWVIEGSQEWAKILPVHGGIPNVLWTDDVTPYKMRKVRILNGGHTASVLAAYLSGHDYVLDLMNDPVFHSYLDGLLQEEVIPTLSLPKEELKAFADAVTDRFANPYIKHSLLDISLNSCAKFTARCLPSLLGFVEKMEALPKRLTCALAAFIQFYQGQQQEGSYVGVREDKTEYVIRDDEEVLQFFEQVWKNSDLQTVAEQVLSKTEFWGRTDLTKIPGLTGQVAEFLEAFRETSVRQVIESLNQEGSYGSK